MKKKVKYMFQRMVNDVNEDSWEGVQSLCELKQRELLAVF